MSVSIPENIEDKIAAVEAEIAELGEKIKAKKAELKQLYRQASGVIKQQVETAILQSATIDLPLSHRVCHP